MTKHQSVPFASHQHPAVSGMAENPAPIVPALPFGLTERRGPFYSRTGCRYPGRAHPELAGFHAGHDRFLVRIPPQSGLSGFPWSLISLLLSACFGPCFGLVPVGARPEAPVFSQGENDKGFPRFDVVLSGMKITGRYRRAYTGRPSRGFGLQGRPPSDWAVAQHGAQRLPMAHGETCGTRRPTCQRKSRHSPTACRRPDRGRTRLTCLAHHRGTLHGRTAIAHRPVQDTGSVRPRPSSPDVAVRGRTQPTGSGVGGATAQPCGTAGHGRQGGRG